MAERANFEVPDNLDFIRGEDDQNEYEQLKSEAERELYEDTVAKQYLGLARDLIESSLWTEWFDPREAEAHKRLAQMKLIEGYCKIGETVKAEELVQKFFEDVPSSYTVEAYLRMGRHHFGEAMQRRAEEVQAKALAESGDAENLVEVQSLVIGETMLLQATGDRKHKKTLDKLNKHKSALSYSSMDEEEKKTYRFLGEQLISFEGGEYSGLMYVRSREDDFLDKTYGSDIVSAKEDAERLMSGEDKSLTFDMQDNSKVLTYINRLIQTATGERA